MDLTLRNRQRVGWVERSDTHQLHLMEMMGFAGSTHPTYCNDIGEHRSPDGAQRNPGLTRRRPRITRSLSSGGASRRPVGSIRATAADNKTGSSDLPVGRFVDRAVESFISDFPKNICSL